MDFDALIGFGLCQSKPKVEHTAKKQNDLPLTIENVDFQAKEPYDAREDQDHKVEIGLCDYGGHRYLHMLKYTPVSDHVQPLEWMRPRPDAKPLDWNLNIEQGSGLESLMKALALEDEPAGSQRKISVPASKGRRIREDLEAQLPVGPKVRVHFSCATYPSMASFRSRGPRL